jgi:hypothetical protein
MVRWTTQAVFDLNVTLNQTWDNCIITVTSYSGVCDNLVLRSTFGPTTKEVVNRSWKQLSNVELCNWYSSPYVRRTISALKLNARLGNLTTSSSVAFCVLLLLHFESMNLNVLYCFSNNTKLTIWVKGRLNEIVFLCIFYHLHKKSKMVWTEIVLTTNKYQQR